MEDARWGLRAESPLPTGHPGPADDPVSVLRRAVRALDDELGRLDDQRLGLSRRRLRLVTALRVLTGVEVMASESQVVAQAGRRSGRPRRYRPGSLPARILAHLRLVGVPQTANEIAAALGVGKEKVQVYFGAKACRDVGVVCVGKVAGEDGFVRKQYAIAPPPVESCAKVEGRPNQEESADGDGRVAADEGGGVRAIV